MSSIILWDDGILYSNKIDCCFWCGEPCCRIDICYEAPLHRECESAVNEDLDRLARLMDRLARLMDDTDFPNEDYYSMEAIKIHLVENLSDSQVHIHLRPYWCDAEQAVRWHAQSGDTQVWNCQGISEAVTAIYESDEEIEEWKLG